MYALLLVAAFIGTFGFLKIYLDDQEWREIFLIASIVIGAVIALLTESLSAMDSLNRNAVIGFWSIYSFVMIGVIAWSIYNQRSYFQASLKSYYGGNLTTVIRRAVTNQGNGLDLTVTIIISFFVFLLLLTAWIAPPNTNDSIFYHMSRVVNWAQNGSLNHYVTPIERQLWMPPWAEYTILNIFLLSGGDSLSNLVQWFGMLGSLVGVSLIAKKLGAPQGGQLFAVLFCFSISMGLLQSSSTQTDYVTAFWTVCLAYFSVVVHQRGLYQANNQKDSHKWLLPLILSLTVALGMLTKGTFIAFALPFMIWLLISILLHHHWLQALQLAAIGIIVGIILNAGVWSRNFQTYKSPLGPSSSLHVNQTFGPGPLISNLIRNSTLHLGTPFGVINGPLRESVEWIHHQLGMSVDDERTTIDDYRVRFSRHEDYAGNPLHFLFIPVSLILIGYPLLSNHRKNTGQKNRKPQDNEEIAGNPFRASTINNVSLLIAYTIVVILGFVFFSLLFKWQATGSRLQLPFFVLWSPVAGLAFTQIDSAMRKSILVIIFLLASLPFLLSNPSRPLLRSNSTPSILRISRTELLFANSPEFMPGYLSIIEAFQNSNCRELGLELDSSHPDYPFWALLSPSASEIHIGYFTDIPELEKYNVIDFEPCAVICTICTNSQWDGLTLDSSHFGGYLLYLDSHSSH